MPYGDKEVLRRLIEFYDYDFSEILGWDVNEHGTFGYRYFDQYESTKRVLAQRDWPTMQHYADAKTAVVEAILARASVA